MILRLLTLLLLFPGTSVVLAAEDEWVYSEKVDAMSDELEQSISITNKDGHSLSAYPDSDGNFWLTISLGGIDQFSHERAPTLRVDKNEPNDLQKTVDLQNLLQDASLNKPLYVWNPKFVNALMGTAKEGLLEVGPPKYTITQFMTGENVVMRYWLSTGGYKDTEFALTGFSENAPKVFRIDSRPAHLTE